MPVFALGKWDFGRWDWDLHYKKSQNGNGIGVLLAYQWDRDTGKWNLEKNGGWEMGLVTPLQDVLCGMRAVVSAMKENMKDSSRCQ